LLDDKTVDAVADKMLVRFDGVFGKSKLAQGKVRRVARSSSDSKASVEVEQHRMKVHPSKILNPERLSSHRVAAIAAMYRHFAAFFLPTGSTCTLSNKLRS